MNLFQKGILQRGNLYRIINRWIAVMMAVVIVTISSVPSLTLVSQAAGTEIQSVKGMKENGGGLTTAYKWKPGASSAFDIEGIEDATLIGADNPYTGNRTKSVITTYQHKGYKTVVRRSGDSGRKDISISTNGGVQTLDDLGIEVQMKVYPSQDQKWILVDYIVYNKRNSNNPIQIASSADVQVGGRRGVGSTDPADSSAITVDKRGFRMVNEATQQTFDCRFRDDSMGLTEPTTKWVGLYRNRENHYFTNGPHRLSGQDSGLTYSWTISLKPYETAVRRVAFSAKGPSYYVSATNGNDSHVGAYDSPLKTIQKAIEKIGNNVGYVYIQNYGELNKTITVPSGANITFMSSDYDRSGNPIEDIVTLRRSSGFSSGELFKTSGGTMRFSNLVLDGNKESASNSKPILMADRGTVGIMKGAVLQNNRVEEGGQGSAIQIVGTANLEMNYGTVTGNVTNDRGAVNFESSGKFIVQNQVFIENNTATGEEKANVYLASGKYMTVADDLGESKIGVTLKQVPGVSVEGTATKVGQEVKVAVPEARSAMNISPSPFVDNFFADKAGPTGTGVYITSGTAGLSGAGANHDRNTVMKKNGYKISFFMKNGDTGGALSVATPSEPITFASGDEVTIEAPSDITGYNMTEVVIDQGESSLLRSQTSPGADFGKITGMMPDNDVTVSYEYRRVDSGIIFQVNGGTPQPRELKGMPGTPINGLLPNVSQYGYIFRGWSKTNDKESTDFVTELPSVYPETPETYYAVFQPDSSVKFNYTVEYTNQSGDIVFQTNTRKKAYSVEASVQAQKKTIHGYEWSLENSGTAPTEYDFSGTPQTVGTFDRTTGAFAGKMPGQDTTILYRYKVKFGDRNARSQLEVHHETKKSTQVSAVQISQHYPEEAINLSPVVRYGYQCVGIRIDKGNTADDTDGNLVSVVKGQTNAGYVFHGVMPNQPVKIVYIYEPTAEGYPLSVQYMDKETTDDRLKYIIPTLAHIHYAEDKVGLIDGQERVEYREQYGYALSDKAMNPPTGLIDWSGNNFTGIMPNDRVTVSYGHNRVPSKWSEITYKTGVNGSLESGTDMSPDVKTLEGGNFKTSVLINDGSALGQEKGYTLSEVKEKRLMPGTNADRYYRLGGWFVDSDNNGILDHGETLLEEDYRFTGSVVLTAHFEKIPDQWIDIYFAAGDRGSINRGEETTLNVTYDKTWGDIVGSLPRYTPEVNYLVDDWYGGETLMEHGMALVKGQTYTIHFYPNPGIFGTKVTVPEAGSGLNDQGKGKITAYNTTEGYQYILTGMDGTILDVIRGNFLSGRVVFDNLYPGSRYKVYEAIGKTQAAAGDMISEAAGIVSTPARVLTPAVERNYQVYYDDEEEGKTRLTIKPGDQSSEYALLTREGDVVITSETAESGWQAPDRKTASLSFRGLDYNQEYTVVARPKGQTDITAQSKQEDGSVITTDPGGELELPEYIIETINGQIEQVGEVTVGAGRYENAHKGDEIKLTAQEVNDDGEPFSHWKMTIGSVQGLGSSISQREISFTMPDTNLVLTVVYKRSMTSQRRAKVVDEVRGGSREELGLDLRNVPHLEKKLTTDDDRELMEVNRADVTYKVVYRKNAVKATESNAVRESGDYDRNHKNAFKGAWGLDVSIERYVNGRKVTMATPSDASFDTYVQLGKGDVDMKDYQLYEIKKDPDDGSWQTVLVPMAYDPEETGGLFTFKAREGARYVMIYNRAYRLYFLNDTVPAQNRYRYYFKVRRNEAPTDSYYSLEYGQLKEQLDYFISFEGAEYSYLGWSYSRDSLRRFDPDRKITRRTHVYAYYEDNEKEVEDTRGKLEKAIREAIKLRDDLFLKLNESKELKGYVGEALEVLDKEEPRATVGQLKEAVEKLKNKAGYYVAILKDRYTHYDQIQEEGNKGGNLGGGGGGAGTKRSPYNMNTPKSYVVGTNGSWGEVSDQESQERQLSFVLNGGMALSNMWAKLKYPEGDMQATGWYHFNRKGIMSTGWYRDEKGDWYYFNMEEDGLFGKMATNWYRDREDGYWYYLDPETGKMVIGWKQIGEKWYYFETQGSGEYVYDPKKERWTIGGRNGRPLGSMFKNEVTPDGYMVDADGAWIQ